MGRSVRSAHFSLGLSQHWYLMASDIQDPSPSWNRDHVSASFRITLPEMSGQIGTSHFKNETRLNILLTKLFPMLGGTGSVSLATDIATTGEWTSVDHGTSLLLGFSGASPEGRQGLFVNTALDIRQSPDDPRETYVGYRNDAQKWNPEFVAAQAKYDTSKMLFFCEEKTASAEGQTWNYHRCLLNNDKHIDGNYFYLGITKEDVITCFDGKERDTLYCEIEQTKKTKGDTKYKGYNVGFELEGKLDEPYSLYHMRGRISIAPERDSLLLLLQEKPDLHTFTQALQEMDGLKQLEALNMLAKLAYATYDDTGLDFAFGNDRINAIGRDEIYKTMRGQLFDPNQNNKTTVCRGIAKMIASVAHDLGYEAHTVSINVDSRIHVITALRKYGENFSLINYGDGTEFSYTRKLEEALLRFAHSNGYPPQLQFVVFDHNGNYERTLITNEGRLLLEFTTPPSELDRFLQFRN